MSRESVMPSNHLILCHPLLSPSIFPSIRVFSNELALCIKWPKYWNFSFSISPSNEYSGLISFRIDRFDLLAIQGILKSLLLTPQFKSINCSALSWNNVYFILWNPSVQFSSVQSLCSVQLFATPWIASRQASLSITNSRSSHKLMCIKSVMPSSHLILCHPLLLPPVPPSIKVFSSESTFRMRWPKY